jgi:hypothetical protein
VAKRKPIDPATLRTDQGPGVKQENPRLDAFLDAIDEMRSSGSFDWADQTLRDIYDWCREAGRYTDRQVVAVNNIRYARHWDELEGV